MQALASSATNKELGQKEHKLQLNDPLVTSENLGSVDGVVLKQHVQTLMDKLDIVASTCARLNKTAKANSARCLKLEDELGSFTLKSDQKDAFLEQEQYFHGKFEKI